MTLGNNGHSPAPQHAPDMRAKAEQIRQQIAQMQTKCVELIQRAAALAAATAGVNPQANGARGGAVDDVAPPAQRT